MNGLEFKCMGYKLNGCNTGAFPFYLIDGLKREYRIPYFVETGTANAESTKEAAKLFDKVWTMELIEGRTEWDLSLKNVEWITGNSIDILPDLIQDLIDEQYSLPKQHDGRAAYLYTVFWLDAHYSDPTPNTSKYKECYLLEELDAISRFQDSAIIFIDDARLFLGPPPAPNNPKDWPTIRQIFELLERRFPFNTTTIRDDYIISLPERLNEPFDAEWRLRYKIRYPSHEDSIKQQTKNIWNEFKKYIDAD
jgi:hypothetical protein